MTVLKKGSRGEDVKELQQALGLVADGVFGEKTEEAVKQYQFNHGLVADGVVGNSTWSSLKGQGEKKLSSPRIQMAPINIHITKKAREIKYLVIHFTAGASSAPGAAKKNRDVFLKREASADFCVDDQTIIQVNPDPKNYYCWAVGDGKGKYGITNSNAISIEICSSLKPGTTAKVPNHSGWYFTPEALENAIWLAKELMKQYNIPIERVIRHYDASRKACPGLLGWNQGPVYDSKTGLKVPGKQNTSEEWEKFKHRIAGLP